MAKALPLYWDSCAWLGLLNGEQDKKRELEVVYGHAKAGKYALWTSTLSMVEVRRLADENGNPKPLDPLNNKKIDDLFLQPFIMPIPLDLEIAGDARRLFRETAGLGKYQDAAVNIGAELWRNQPGQSAGLFREEKRMKWIRCELVLRLARLLRVPLEVHPSFLAAGKCSLNTAGYSSDPK